MKTRKWYVLEITLALLLAALLARTISAEPLTLAVLACKNNADSAHEDFVKGIPDMFMTGFARSDGIQLVERIQIDRALQSEALETHLLDIRRGLRVGKWVKADAILLTSFTTADDEFRLDARMIATKNGKQIAAEKAAGSVRDLLRRIDRLCRQLEISALGEATHKATATGILLVEYKVTQAMFSDRDFYHQKCRIFVDDHLLAESPVINELNTPYVLVRAPLSAGNHVIVVKHGYVDAKGKWIKALGKQPKSFLVNIRPAGVHRIDYRYRLGTIRANYEYDNRASLHAAVKKIL